MNRLTDDAGALLRAPAESMDVGGDAATADGEMLAGVFRHSLSAIHIFDKNFRILAANPAFLRASGYALDEVLGEDARMLLDPEQAATRQTEIAAALESHGGWEGELWSRRKNGSTFPQWVSLVRVFDADGVLRHTIASAIDITELKRVETELRASEQQLRLMGNVFEHAAQPIFATDVENRIIAANSAYTRLMQYSLDEMIGHQTVEFLAGRSAPGLSPDIQTSLDENGLWQGEIMRRRRDGSLVPTWTSLARFHDEKGNILYHISNLFDLTERRAVEARMALLASVFEHAAEPIYVTDGEHRIIAVNPAFLRTMGYRAEELLGNNAHDFLSPEGVDEKKAEIIEALEHHGHWQGEVERRRRDGSIIPTWASVARVRDENGKALFNVAGLFDLTEIKEAEREIQRLAHHDALTGLPNRLNLEARVEQAINIAHRAGQKMALMVFDLDRFKTINDTLGHSLGDGLLIEVGRRLVANVRESDIVARLGGDEFVVVLTGMEGPATAAPILDKMMQNLSLTYHIGGHQLHTTPSVGIAIYPNDGITLQDLLKNADSAMYLAKAEGRNTFRFFTRSINLAAEERLALENSMREGLTRNEFLLHFQPQVAVGSGQVIGFEALMRWNHPERGLIAPARFIPIAEETGMIRELGAFALREGLRQLRAWRGPRRKGGAISINVSAQQLRDPRFPLLVAEALVESEIAPADLELEITESAAMHNPNSTVAILNELRAIGVRLAIDDFGTGYSSLSYLKLLPIQRLKLDASFVRDLESDPNDAAICAATIGLAHNLHLEVVAEGVETSAQLAFMRGARCDFAQGYHFSRPVPPADAAGLFESIK